MRARSTWQKNSDTPRQAATSRKADIYTMNQDHPQPTPVDYVNGDPDSWAETPVSGDKMSVNAEYDGAQVKRNELGFGEFRDDTFKHKDSDQWNGKGKYDNTKVAAERKASACERLARATLRTANSQLIEGAAIDFMALPDRSIVAMLKRLDAVSPDALPQQAKFKRALACTKLAARLLGSAANSDNVERLGSVMMTIDDPTLKSMVRTIASARVAEGQQEEQQDDDGQVAGQGDDQQDDDDQQQQESHGLNPNEQAMLSDMLSEEGGGAGAACPPCPPGASGAPGAPGAAQPMDDLSALFSGAPQGAPPGEISFDGDDDVAPTQTSMASDLDAIFADDPEVQAQRQIASARSEAMGRDSFTGRVASANNGAKKLGTVKKSASTSVDQVLETLWERP